MDERLIDEILDFWFNSSSRPYWFRRSDSFDRLVADNLLEYHEKAAAGAYDAWMEDIDGCLALCILLDQAPRNMFRATARAFATDAKALAVARHAVDRGFDLECEPAERLFLYLPFEHSENLDDQRRCVELVRERIGLPEQLDYAERHLRIIERFGRFPHRNAALGRESTPAELAFLLEPGSSF